MTHHAKATSAGSTEAGGSSRGLFRRAFATRGVSSDAKGSGARSPRRLRATLVVLALAIAAFAISAAPALAAPIVTTPVVTDVSYTTAKVSSEVDPQNSFVIYNFEVSTNGTNWTPNAGGSIFSKETLNATLTGLDDATPYFVRLKTSTFVPPSEGFSPGPNPSFTTLNADPPTIPGTVAASGVFSTSAKGTGEVNRPAASDNVTCQFEYVTDAEFTGNPPGEGFAGATVRPCAENPIEAAGTKAVSAPLGCTNPLTEPGNCLSPATTYHLRLVAENAGGTVTKDASNFTTQPTVTDKPIVIATDNATQVSKRSAQASGEIERPAGADPALNVECRFEYVTEEHFTAEGFAGAEQTPCAQNPITSPAPGSPAVSADVSAELSGLIPVTTYHLRLTAENGAGSVSKNAAATFTTIAVVHPTLTIDSITEVGYTSFTVTGTADPGNQGVYPFFEFAPVGTEEWGGNPIGRFPPFGAGSPAKQLSFTFPCGFYEYEGSSGFLCDSPPLKPGTTYKVRFRGQDLEENNQYVSAEPFPEFTTKGTSTPPSATLSVSGVTGTSAHFSGTVDTHAPAGPLPDEAKAAYKTEWHIECTPECKDVNENVIGGTVEAEEGSKAISVDAKRLEPNTHYKEVKLIATDALGTFETPLQSFDTLVIPPTVKAALGNSDGKGGYTLQGVVNPNNDVISACSFEWGPNSAEYTFSTPCSPLPSEGSKPISVEAHLTGLTPGATYHDKLVVTYGAGSKADGGDQSFVPTLSPPETCENEQLRKENSSLALPECRAYELVTPMGKEGFPALLETFDGGERVAFGSRATNIATSGQNKGDLGESSNKYVAARTATGWETIPDLNGSSGSFRDEPSNVDSNPFATSIRAYSSDLRSSVWNLHRQGDPGSPGTPMMQLRSPDGTFEPIGFTVSGNGFASIATSDDLSHLITWGSQWGPGVYEFIGTGMDQPRRVDLDNSGAPISTCGSGTEVPGNAVNQSVSSDGSRIVNYVFGGCGGANPPAAELWARVNGTTSFDVSASQCNRVAPAPVCNAPANPTFAAATPDGSRVFFTTTQQLLDGDTNQTNDIYYCDLPSGDPAPTAGKANPCSALRQISVAETGAAEVEEVLTTSEDGSTVLFTAKGVLADNEDALGQEAVAGDHNLYVWRQDSAQPDGQAAFVGRLDSNDLITGEGPLRTPPQVTPDGRYVVFTTATPLVETDTDASRDVYRYDADTGDLTRVSTNVFGVAGNGDFDAAIAAPTERNSTTTISDNGQKIIFTTAEALSPVDGNAETDVYLWTPARVALISTGSSGSAPRDLIGGLRNPRVAIDSSGKDVYFESTQQLTPADGDSATDVYDARIDGGFSFAPPPICSGEKCQPDATPPPPKKAPLSAQPGPGNPPQPKPCPKGKVRKKSGKCVKKPKKHHGKKHHGKKASHKQGGGK